MPKNQSCQKKSMAITPLYHLWILALLCFETSFLHGHGHAFLGPGIGDFRGWLPLHREGAGYRLQWSRAGGGGSGRPGCAVTRWWSGMGWRGIISSKMVRWFSRLKRRVKIFQWNFLKHKFQGIRNDTLIAVEVERAKSRLYYNSMEWAKKTSRNFGTKNCDIWVCLLYYMGVSQNLTDLLRCPTKRHCLPTLWGDLRPKVLRPTPYRRHTWSLSWVGWWLKS